MLLEPALELDRDPSAEPDPLAAKVADLVAAGRRGDAILHFNQSIGVPEAVTADMLSGIATPTLVVTSEATDDRLRRWVRAVAEAMPNIAASPASGTASPRRPSRPSWSCSSSAHSTTNAARSRTNPA